MTQKEARQYFTNRPEHGFSWASIGSFTELLSQAEITKPEAALALGCSTGHDLVALRLHCGDNTQLFGVDNNHHLYITLT